MRQRKWITAGAVAAACLAALTMPAWTHAAKRVAAAGDIACAPSSPAFNGGDGTASSCRHLSTSNLLMGGRHDAVLTLGDNQYLDGSLAGFLSSYDAAWGRLKDRTRPAVGNHDYGTLGASGYFDYFNGVGAGDGRAGPRGVGYYSFDLGRWHLVALNSNCGQVGCAAGSAQQQWLRRDLAQTRSRCTLAYWHHPRFSSGTHGSDAALTPMWRTLQRAGVELALAGHDHDYERFVPKRANGTVSKRGVRQFVVGTGGKELRAFSVVEQGSRKRITGTHGVLELQLGRRGYEWAFTAALDGRSLDRGRARCR